jgi:hypothetical protein
LIAVLLAGVAAGLVGAGCGGATQAPAEEPESSVGSVAESRDDDDDSAEIGDGDDGPAEASRAACTDETCFACGEGLCLKGMYCDATAGPGCSWLPECAKQPSCACITRVLGKDCKCDESGGGPLVECAPG